MVIRCYKSPKWVITIVFKCGLEHCRAKDKATLKHATFTPRLVAAAAAYISVLKRGRVSVELKDDKVIVKPIAGAEMICYDGFEN